MSVNYWRREGRVKLYDYTRAPNPRRVRIFLAEKGITVPMVQLDLFQGAHLTPEALKRNPYRGLPVLELDDGTCIAESVAICRYFEELHPHPPLMGVDAVDAVLNHAIPPDDDIADPVLEDGSDHHRILTPADASPRRRPQPPARSKVRNRRFPAIRCRQDER